MGEAAKALLGELKAKESKFNKQISVAGNAPIKTSAQSVLVTKDAPKAPKPKKKFKSEVAKSSASMTASSPKPSEPFNIVPFAVLGGIGAVGAGGAFALSKL